jgi:hypothetical protein
MTSEEFDALMTLIKKLADEAVIDARPAHNRLAATDGGEQAIEMARIYLVTDNG